MESILVFVVLLMLLLVAVFALVILCLETYRGLKWIGRTWRKAPDRTALTWSWGRTVWKGTSRCSLLMLVLRLIIDSNKAVGETVTLVMAALLFPVAVGVLVGVFLHRQHEKGNPLV